MVDGATPRSAAGLPWRDAGRQRAGQWGRCRREQFMPRRLSSGRLAQQSSELAAVRLAAIKGKPDCFVFQDAIQFESRNAEVLGNLAQ